jgi:hypothetical protein
MRCAIDEARSSFSRAVRAGERGDCVLESIVILRSKGKRVAWPANVQYSRAAL